MSITSISSSELKADISTHGAEMLALRSHGRDILWDGDPRFWTGHAPVLFPIVGEVKGGHIRVDGRPYPMGRHGFARTSTFELIAAQPERCRFRLIDSANTRKAYPFSFVLEIEYAIQKRTLIIEASLSNPDPSHALPASFGLHPAFRRPLPFGGSFQDHCVVFSRSEDAPIRQLRNNLLTSNPRSSPVQDRHLTLSDSLFDDDALIFDQVRSRSVWYGAPSQPGLRVEFSDFPYLGIWSKPGAGFLCIEPWQGLASEEDFDGEFATKRGVITIQPGAAKSWTCSITAEANTC